MNLLTYPDSAKFDVFPISFEMSMFSDPETMTIQHD